jgi:hypothetical protein
MQKYVGRSSNPTGTRGGKGYNESGKVYGRRKKILGF